MGVPGGPDACDNALHGVVVERFAVGPRGAVRERLKGRVHPIWPPSLQARERILEELSRACIGDERRDCPHDVRTFPERGPIEPEGAKEHRMPFDISFGGRL